jgi:S1-C subfamily serine protease
MYPDADKGIIAKARNMHYFICQANKAGVEGGLYINELGQEGMTEKAGLQAGDIIIGINGVRTPSLDSFRVEMTKAGTMTCLIEYMRLTSVGEYQICQAEVEEINSIVGIDITEI